MRFGHSTKPKQGGFRGWQAACRIMFLVVVSMLVLLVGCDAVTNKVKCRDCGGTGDCGPCGGDGKHVIWAAGCSHCKNDGVCTTCNGYGYTLD